MACPGPKAGIPDKAAIDPRQITVPKIIVLFMAAPILLISPAKAKAVGGQPNRS